MTTGMARSTSESNAAGLRDAKVIGLISAAHFVSHYYILLLPPIFALIKADLGVSYTELAVALTAFNVVSATLQTPAGFLIDRLGPRTLLTGGLLLGAGAVAAAALFPGYWMLVGAFAVLGLANTVYHPADYTILSNAVTGNRVGRAFSIHTFSGYLGSGVAPLIMPLCAIAWGWRGALLSAAMLGVGVAVLLLLQGRVLSERVAVAPAATKSSTAPLQEGWRLLFSAPILRNLLFFTLLALSGGGLQNFSVVALGELHGTPAATASLALSGFLLLSALGVLLGGFVADRTARHERVAAACFIGTGTMVLLIGWIDLGAVLLVLAMSLGGLLNGIIQPSRDMMVRAVTPPGSFGKVFGFVSTGFNIGGTVSPLLFAWLLDHGEPRLIFMVTAGFILLSLLTVLTRPTARPAASAVARRAVAGTSD